MSRPEPFAVPCCLPRPFTACTSRRDPVGSDPDGLTGARRYLDARKYLKIDRRLDVLNARMDIMKELFELLHNELDHRHGSFLEWIVIVLIVVEIVISVGEWGWQLYLYNKTHLIV
jgi:hypothetical protein